MAKTRVHELAKEFGVDSKTVLAKLKEMGEFVKSASSTVEAPVARRLRAAFVASSASSPAPVQSDGGGGPKVSARPAPAKRWRTGQPTGQPLSCVRYCLTFRRWPIPL